jgi:hypothetical protein
MIKLTIGSDTNCESESEKREKPALQNAEMEWKTLKYKVWSGSLKTKIHRPNNKRIPIHSIIRVILKM